MIITWVLCVRVSGHSCCDQFYDFIVWMGCEFHMSIFNQAVQIC